MIRAIVFAATVAALFSMWMDRPPPPRVARADYCWIDMYAAAKDDYGNVLKFWTKGFGPCSQLDRYENI